MIKSQIPSNRQKLPFPQQMEAAAQTAHPTQSAGHSSALRANLIGSVAAGLIVFAILGSFLIRKHYQLFGQMPSDNLFVYLSWSFLHGHLDCLTVPTTHDLSLFHGKYYAYWPPLPAFLFMPAVLWHGLEVGDKWLSIAFVAISTSAQWFLIDAVAKTNNWRPSTSYRVLMSVFLAFGTSNLVLSLRGSHWYVATVSAVMMMMIAVTILLIAQKRWWHSLLAGAFWAMAILGRMHLILAAPLFFYFAIAGGAQKPDWTSLRQNWRPACARIIGLTAPVLMVLAFFAWYNWARFGSVFDNGIKYHHMALRFIDDYHKFGYFSLHYIAYNAYYTLLRLPGFETQQLFAEPGKYHEWRMGYSLFFQSPVFLYALLSLKRVKTDRLVQLFSLCIVLVGTPIMCCMGTGWSQYGARYLFDLCPFLIPLTIIGTRSRVSILLIALVIASVLSNLYGLHLFGLI